MTVLTMPAPAGQDTALRPVPWRRMAWVTWRQHRPTLISLPVVLGAVAVFLWIAGLRIHHNYALLTACHPFSSNACQTLNSNFNGTDWTMANTIDIFMNLAPALIGAFAGAPVLARELETGTYRYAWTQGFGRARWTIAKLALLAVAVTAVAGAFSQVFVWFFQPFLGQESLTLFSATVFATHGIAFAAWTLIAFAIGALAGMGIRRIVPAMAATLGAYTGLALATWLFLREHYPLALVTNHPSINPAPFSANDSWVLSTWYTGPGGKPASQSTLNQIFALFPHNGGGPRVKETLAQEFAQHDITVWQRYIPVSRFWPMQFVEAGWLLALSVLLIAATVWLVRRRAA
jgi:ABC-type transport system involved in multi-copper enzyme maturation permease subunit